MYTLKQTIRCLNKLLPNICVMTTGTQLLFTTLSFVAHVYLDTLAHTAAARSFGPHSLGIKLGMAMNQSYRLRVACGSVHPPPGMGQHTSVSVATPKRGLGSNRAPTEQSSERKGKEASVCGCQVWPCANGLLLQCVVDPEPPTPGHTQFPEPPTQGVLSGPSWSWYGCSERKTTV